MSTRKKWQDFKKARKFTHTLGLKSESEWREYLKSKKKPSDIPSDPSRIYKNDGWKNWGDWLGSGRIADQYKEYKIFTEVRKYVHLLKLKSEKEWRNHWKSEKRPDNIPYKPERTYKNEGWNGWGDFLGTGQIKAQDREFKRFKEARKYARSLGLKSEKEWRNYCKLGNKPLEIPYHPERIYKNEGWDGYADWLNTSRFKKFLLFNDARNFVHSLKLKSTNEWTEYCESGKKPDNIPIDPSKTYKNEGWKNWGDWLGTNKHYTIQLINNLLKDLLIDEIDDEILLINILNHYGIKEKIGKNVYDQLISCKPKTGKRLKILEDALKLFSNKNHNSPAELNDDTLELTDESDEVIKFVVTNELHEKENSNVKLLEIEDSLPTIDSELRMLKNFDKEYKILQSDHEFISSILNHQVNRIWYKILQNEQEINKLRKLRS